MRNDIIFFANADAIRVNPKFEDVIIPVEWVMEKRSPAKTRETLKRAGEAFAEEKCIVIFPSGRLARKEGDRLIEKDWFSVITSYSIHYTKLYEGSGPLRLWDGSLPGCPGDAEPPDVPEGRQHWRV